MPSHIRKLKFSLGARQGPVIATEPSEPHRGHCTQLASWVHGCLRGFSLGNTELLLQRLPTSVSMVSLGARHSDTKAGWESGRLCAHVSEVKGWGMCAQEEELKLLSWEHR